MLPRNRKISKTEFKSLGRGVGYHTPFVSLYVYKKSEHTPTQFSIICQKKQIKHAFLRNRLKRRSFNIIKKHIASISPGFYAVFTLKKSALDTPTTDFESSFTSLLNTSGLMMKSHN